MKISVVTAVLNRVETIGSAIESLDRQSFGAVEHIVQDGGSTDGTLEILAAHAAPHRWIKSTADGGIYDALNRGIARANGEIVGILHADDVFAASDVLAQVAEAFADPKVVGVYGDLVYVAQHDVTRVIRHWRAGAYRPGMLARGWMPPHPTLFLRREVFERYGTYNTDYRIAADYEAILRWLGAGIALSYIPKVLVRMRMGGASNRSLGQIWRKSQEDYRALRTHGVGGLPTLAAKNFGKLGQFLPQPTRKQLP